MTNTPDIKTPRARSPRGALTFIDHLVDAGTYQPWTSPPLDGIFDEKYMAELEDAQTKSGVDESVLVGEALIDGQRVVTLVSEFSFLGGSIGVAAADRLVTAIERATAEQLPIIASPASGGTRMQEGTLAFLSMVKVCAAIALHKKAKLPYLVYLRNPTTGGALASWGSLGHITLAEPGALIGFLGPRVYEAIHADVFPPGVQVSENLLANGLIDGVSGPAEARAQIAQVLSVLAPATSADRECVALPAEATVPVVHKRESTWSSILSSRRRHRPGVRDLLRHGAGQVALLSPAIQEGHGPALFLALARFGAISCMVIGQNRQPKKATTPLGPAELREAQRGLRLAHELNLPILTVIDTEGAALTPDAEEGGLAREIAHCISAMAMHPGQSISLIIGQGCGGGALALLPADRSLAAQHGWLSPLPLEGASAIVYRDTAHVPLMAEKQGVGSQALRNNGIVDWVIPELPDATDEAVAFCRRVSLTVEAFFNELQQEDPTDRFNNRLKRFRALGALQLEVEDSKS